MLRIPLLSLSFILSLVIFQAGFLLRRKEIHVKSTCADFRSEPHGCWSTKQQGKVVLLVVDALRHDFLTPLGPDELPLTAQQQHYRGQMRAVAGLLEKGAALGNILADPPTTTLQRLKALTTGTFPTFIDASDNFSPDARVFEDNWVSQSASRNMSTAFLGDDTWLSLFPDQFVQSTGFSSFDFNDIHSVDEKVEELLQGLLSNDKSWDLIVAHVLGVDHCGHKFGPAHPQMGNTLRRTDDLIAMTSSKLEANDLLIVIGDHGMTATGDHGGDSNEETHAAIMLYSPGRNYSLSPSSPIHQIDLVPTLSLLLGLPIPFSNLGTVIEGAIPSNIYQTSVALNYEQMRRFAMTYAAENSFGELFDLTAHEATDTKEQLLMMSRIQHTLRAAWTRFDWPMMRTGLVSLLEATLFVLSDRNIDVAMIIVRTGFLLLQSAILSAGAEENPATPLLMVVLPLSVLYSLTSLVLAAVPVGIGSLPRLVAVIAVLLHSISLSSNSFLVYEGTCVRFLLQSVLVVAAVSKIYRLKVPLRRSVTFSSLLNTREMKYLVFALVLIRCEPLFHRCREEEKDCQSYYPVAVLGTISEDAIFWRLLVCVASMCGMHAVTKRTVPDTTHGTRGWLRPFLAIGQLAIVSASLHHASNAVMAGGSHEQFSMASMLFASFVYCCSVVGVVLALCNRRRVSARETHVCLFYAVTWSFYVLLGDGILPAFCGLLLLLRCVHEVCDQESLGWISSLIVSFGYYFTGHTPTINAIPWQAAFVGVPGNFPVQVVPATLVLSHIGVSSVLVGLSLPLHGLSSLRTMYSLVGVCSSRALTVSFVAFLHRRHLMVWKVFAPKFIFESISFIVLLFVTNLIVLFSRKLLNK